MKKLGLTMLAALVAVAGALYWLRGNMDGLVKDAIEKYGSAMTQARVTVASVEIQPGDGRGVIRGLTIGNPAGFKTPHALKVGEIEVAIDLASVAGDVVTLRKIRIAAPDINYEKGAAMTNFDALQKNIADYVGPSNKKPSGGNKLVVEELTVRGAKAQASAAFIYDKSLALALPDITLRNLGKARGGMTPGELGQEIATALEQRLAASVNFDRLRKSAGQQIENADKQIKNAGSAISGLFGK